MGDAAAPPDARLIARDAAPPDGGPDVARPPPTPDARPADAAIVDAGAGIDATPDLGTVDAAARLDRGVPTDARPVDARATDDGGEPDAVVDAAGHDSAVDGGPIGLDGFPWFFAIHAGEVRYDGLFAERAFTEVVALGGRGVRTDIFWKDVEPERDRWDARKMAFYDDYIDRALANDLVPMMIFSNPAEWAIAMYRAGQRDAFWAEYEAYIRRTVALMADRVDHYQLWNEPNHVIDIVEAGDDWQLIERAGRIVREMDPGAVLYVNVMANVPGWEEAISDWVMRAGDHIDVIGVDHYPGTWACCDNRDWTPLETLIRRINDPEDVLFGKLGAVMETGYSSWAPVVADEARQRAWINESLPRMRALVTDANANQRFGIVLGDYYQLIDVDTDGVGQEAHFGILHTDLSHKEGYADLRRQIEAF